MVTAAAAAFLLMPSACLNMARAAATREGGENSEPKPSRAISARLSDALHSLPARATRCVRMQNEARNQGSMQRRASRARRIESALTPVAVAHRSLSLGCLTACLPLDSQTPAQNPLHSPIYLHALISSRHSRNFLVLLLFSTARTIAMQSLAKQHLQQHAALMQERLQQQQRNSSNASGGAAPTGRSRAEVLAAFPLTAASSAAAAAKTKSSKGTAKATGLSKAPSSSFAAKSARRAASSRAVIRRAKLIARKAPRPSLLERAERSLGGQDAPEQAQATAQRNLRILSHSSDRKKKTQEAMKKVSCGPRSLRAASSLLLSLPDDQRALLEAMQSASADVLLSRLCMCACAFVCRSCSRRLCRLVTRRRRTTKTRKRTKGATTSTTPKSTTSWTNLSRGAVPLFVVSSLPFSIHSNVF